MYKNSFLVWEHIKNHATIYLFMIILFLTGIIFGAVFGGCTEVSHMKREAVRVGHAEWIIDTSGMPQFKWKESKP